MRLFGLIGKPLTHSFSKRYFTDKFIQEKINDCSYELFELQSIDDFPALIDRHPDLAGLNVTIPYKEAVLPFLDVKSEVVSTINACNTIRLIDQKLYGFNTDVLGFRRSLLQHLPKGHTHALILGSGGASKAIRYVLGKLDISFQQISRKKQEGFITYEEITPELLKKHTLIINTTPLGTYPKVNEAPDLPYSFLSPDHFLFDVVYNPEKSLFLSEGEKRGAKILNGAEMLQYQAEESWAIWNEIQ